MAYTFIIEPKEYTPFDNEWEQIDRCKQWGLLSDKASKTKDYVYKVNGMTYSCQIIGYVDDITAVIAFDNQFKHCVHPSYLKEMQASGFNQRGVSAVEGSETTELSEASDASGTSDTLKADQSVTDQARKQAVPSEPKVKPAPKEKTNTSTKAVKIDLPEGKVQMSATVQAFTTVPNHFAEEDDEVIIYEDVMFVEPATEIGVAWSSHSATLKKLELQIGDKLTFDAKIAKKKLTKHPVPYKINNPSKIQKG